MKGLEKFTLAAALIGLAGIAQAAPAEKVNSNNAQSETQAKASTVAVKNVKADTKHEEMTSADRDLQFTLTHPNY
ncbi:hypothetical protein [Oceanobacter mangrovi]|uniref:hypothetical protein n=1 Tax=Oceanobacter mangrovi TaxID=2862510 RepID=UPI001C8D77E7|nr:hypothetical protein [Oceanobacter mangrovi]